MSYREMWAQVDVMAATHRNVVERLKLLSFRVNLLPDGSLQAKCLKRTGPLAGVEVKANDVLLLEKAVERVVNQASRVRR